MSEDHTKELNLVGAFIGAAVGYGFAKLASIAPGITERFPGLFKPFWTYFPPIGVIGAIIAALVASIISPAGRIRGTADLAGVTVGIAVCLTLLPERPNIFMIFLVTIAYGFIGFVAGSFISEIKGAGRSSD
jgi:hypothetical protein